MISYSKGNLATAAVAAVLALSAPWASAQQFTILHHFGSVTNDGRYSVSTLTLDGTTLYGMAAAGGMAGTGIIFRINTDGSGYQILHHFTGTTNNDGALGVVGGIAGGAGPLVLDGGTLYGATRYGGTYDRGTVFKIDTNGNNYTILYHFNGTDGSRPGGALTRDGTTLYGLTPYGGANNLGVAFRLNTDGSGFTNLYTFSSASGSTPFGFPTLSGTSLYGMTYNGGVSNLGVIFRLNSEGGGYAHLHDFVGGSNDGRQARGSLTLSGTNLYGMTTMGGSSGWGVVFRMNMDGSGFTVLRSLGGNYGQDPWGEVLVSGSALYGMTQQGGTAAKGVLFRMKTDGSSYQVLHTFTGDATNGAYPKGSLTLFGSTLYGVTTSGGAYSNGVIFSLALPMYTLTVESEHGGTWPGTVTTNWAQDLVQSVTNSPASGGVGTQYVCVGAVVISNDYTLVSPTNITLTLTNDATLTWQWQTQYWLDIEAGSGGSVDQPDQWVVAGSNVIVTATPADHYYFSHWSGDTNGCEMAGNVITVAMTQARSITANFAPDQHTLTVVSEQGGDWPGTVTTNWGTALEQWVTNSPVSGGVGTQYVCVGAVVISNDYTLGSATNITLTLTNDATLTWQWQTQYWLDIEAGSGGSVDQPDQWGVAGSNITVTATPSNYYHFSSWDGDIDGCAITGNQIAVHMDKPRTILAGFVADMATNGVPHWWLAQYGLPTDDDGALFDEGDGVPAWQEYFADTDPTNSDSVLAPIGIAVDESGVRIDWKGGQWATQYVESCVDLGSTTPVWTCIHTNATLPTPVTNFIVDSAATNSVLFYRIKAGR
jgi:uncharacterized repeat protein (TIGR03803 family)